MPAKPTRRETIAQVLDNKPILLDVLLERLTQEDKTPGKLCWELGLTWGGVLAWASQDEERVQKIKNALEIRGHLLAEQALQIADKAKNIPKAKLQVDTRKWLATNFNPKFYAEKKEISHTGSVGLIQLLSSLPRVEPEKLVESGGVLVPESTAEKNPA